MPIPARSRLGLVLLLAGLTLIACTETNDVPVEVWQGASTPPEVPASRNAVGDVPETPTFEAHPVDPSSLGEPAPVDLSSHPRARRFRTVLSRGAAEGPNFAGHYTVVSWGCGTMCQEFMIVDARTGRVFDGRTTALGIEYQLESDLLVINPPERAAETPCPGQACAPQYLRWIDDRLEPVIAAGEGERIRRATREFIRTQTEVDSVAVEIDALSGEWARVRVIPEAGVTDPAIVYLRRVENAWRVVLIGTAFTPDDLNEAGVPQEVRPSL